MVNIVGLGGTNTFEKAQGFRQRHGMTVVPMLWDPSLDSWSKLEVTGTPDAILLDRQGTVVKRWHGMFDEEEVLELAGRA